MIKLLVDSRGFLLTDVCVSVRGLFWREEITDSLASLDMMENGVRRRVHTLLVRKDSRDSMRHNTVKSNQDLSGVIYLEHVVLLSMRQSFQSQKVPITFASNR